MRQPPDAHLDRAGAVAVEVADETLLLEPGDAVSCSSDVPHAYGNPHRTSSRFALSVSEPDVGTASRKATRA